MVDLSFKDECGCPECVALNRNRLNKTFSLYVIYRAHMANKEADGDLLTLIINAYTNIEMMQLYDDWWNDEYHGRKPFT